jgi:hypothetical protein
MKARGQRLMSTRQQRAANFSKVKISAENDLKLMDQFHEPSQPMLLATSVDPETRIAAKTPSTRKGLHVPPMSEGMQPRWGWKRMLTTIPG